MEDFPAIYGIKATGPRMTECAVFYHAESKKLIDKMHKYGIIFAYSFGGKNGRKDLIYMMIRNEMDKDRKGFFLHLNQVYLQLTVLGVSFNA